MKRWLIWLSICLVVIVIIVYYGVLFGHSNQEGMVCFFKDAFDIECPGCGGQRAVAAILQGDFIEAFYLNPLIYGYLSLIIYLVILLIEGYVLKNQKVIDKMSLPTYFGYVFLAIIIFFTIVRNLI